MLDLKAMLKAGIHFGHKTSRWSPAMSPYIWGSRNQIHLIDVSKTAFLLERTGKYLKDLAKTGGTFLFIGTKKPAHKSIQKIAETLKMPYVVHRWIGGTLSNHGQIKKAITKLLHLKDVVSKSKTGYKKKEISMIQKEIARLEKNIGGILDLTYPPAAIIVVDAKKENSSIREALSLKIPTVAIVDTNTDPAGINFVIPANDDSPRSISFVLEYLEACIADGKKEYETKKAELKVEKAKKTKVIEKKVVARKIEKKVAAKPKEDKSKKIESQAVETKSTSTKATNTVKKENPKTTKAEEAPIKKAVAKKANRPSSKDKK